MSGVLCGYSREKQEGNSEYIKNQLQEDVAYEQMSLREFVDPFTGEPVHHNKKQPTALAVVCDRLRLADFSGGF